ncbi:two-component system, chemotaxis family, response regulator CheV [Evansella caseinilytica]|uniref:Two-component system, chemotaxis family, response regulator CheV n=1 Tax=Evansella caseinilytica TaxID=1503961 RepID=A0A1H3U910_9BACI|nr:chemotaxis protein CheW [Evansella caseinilytica]SDZ58950.1 two-component system, chemotaxis family, response regulator CheV [Evansella caseinilytica]
MKNYQSAAAVDNEANDLEVIAFSISEGVFGLDIFNIKEIIQPMALTVIPHSHPHVEGIIRLREEVIPVINMAKVIGFSESGKTEEDKLIVTEKNGEKVALHVHAVSRIHRVSPEQIEEPSKISQGLKDVTSGVVKMDEETMLLLDYDKIVGEIIIK